MVWRKDDDQHRQRVLWEHVPYPARWQYDCLVEECCRRELWDGVMTLNRARRLSDVEDPDDCLASLAAVGLVEILDTPTGEKVVRLVEVGRHIPDEEKRAEKKRKQDAARKRDQRKRDCLAGKHSKDCDPKTCPAKRAARAAEEGASVTPPITSVIASLGGPEPVPVPVPGRQRDASVTHAQGERDAESDPADWPSASRDARDADAGGSTWGA